MAQWLDDKETRRVEIEEEKGEEEEKACDNNERQRKGKGEKKLSDRKERRIGEERGISKGKQAVNGHYNHGDVQQHATQVLHVIMEE